ncbi:hypothetical protein NMY22_g18349 [Coprinellus aureogranulatus]|nr:hypothetical protein NMY22_g18349 [Coprinellus aureogranulatus]
MVAIARKGARPSTSKVGAMHCKGEASRFTDPTAFLRRRHAPQPPYGSRRSANVGAKSRPVAISAMPAPLLVPCESRPLPVQIPSSHMKQALFPAFSAPTPTQERNVDPNVVHSPCSVNVQGNVPLYCCLGSEGDLRLRLPHATDADAPKPDESPRERCCRNYGQTMAGGKRRTGMRSGPKQWNEEGSMNPKGQRRRRG